MKENLYIDLDEDIQSVIQKIQAVEAENLDLVVPTGARVLQNIVDAHLLKEAGDENGKVLTIVTSDLMGKIFAERVGLAVSGQFGSGNNPNRVMATQASSGTGRISDIIPRRKGIPVGSLTSKKQTAYLNPNTAKVRPSASSKKDKNSGKSASFFSQKDKGEAGASFLKSYKEERNKNNVFEDLSRINKRRFSFPFKMNPTSFIAGVVVLSLVIGAVVFSQTLPKVNLVVFPVRQPMAQTIDVLISSKDPKADLEKGLIPGELLTLEKSENGSFPATGVKDVSEKAKGKITIFNSYSSQVQKLVVSRFQSADGKIFWLTKAITIPGAVIKDGKTTPGQIVADVIAAEPGEAYNIPAGKLIMPALKGTPKAEKIYATSDAPMAGGKAGRANVVSNDDVSKALDSLKEKLRPQLDSFKQNLPSGFQLWPEVYNEELADSSTNPEVGNSADTFNATVKMVARAVVFKSADLDNYVNKEISSNLGEGKTLLSSSKEISFVKPPVVDYQKGTVLAALNIKYDMLDRFDADSFKSSILDKNEKEIKKTISGYKNIERIEVNMWPFWVRTVPANPDRVIIKIQGL